MPVGRALRPSADILKTLWSPTVRRGFTSRSLAGEREVVAELGDGVHPSPGRHNMTKHILVPLDFSASSDAALSYAIDLASHVHARLTLCHVIPLLPFSEARLLSPIIEVEDEVRLAFEVRLQRVRKMNLEAHTVIVHGDPWQQIVETATRHKAI